MLKTLQNALKIKEIRTKLLYTFAILIIVRLGSLLPLPGTDSDVISEIMSGFSSNDAFDFFSAFTGGSFESFSVFALSITPYITSSIIMQLLTIAIPKLEELQKDGESGRKKIAEITRYVTVGLALVESFAMSIGFGSKGIFGDTSEMSSAKYFYVMAVSIIALTAGSAVLMWLGERITENGIGNGISIILMCNIVSRIPGDLVTLYENKVAITDTNNRSIGEAVLAAAVIIAVLVIIVAFVVTLQAGERRISVQYAKKNQGRRMVGGQSSFIPLKVNTAGVIPVIFASSLLQFPVIISSLFGSTPGSAGIWGKILKVLSSSYWFDISSLKSFSYSVGYVFYGLLVIGFAYFYTSITFNPIEVANNMKKQGGFVPGIRPGKPTEDYLIKILNYVVFIGGAGLLIVATIPHVLSGVFDAKITFLGTSIIIIVGVILDTLSKIESMMAVRNYKGFLND